MQNPVATVIIPEHKRPDHLKRLLDYFSGSDINIIVTDSSDVVFKHLEEFKDRIIYRHYPATPLAEKIHYILPLIETPYVFMCANDDFIVPASVSKIVDFLETHRSYNSGQGIYTDFTLSGDMLQTSLRYANTTDIDLAQERPVERLFALQSNYFQYYYCVFRAEMFKKVISSVMMENSPLIRNLCLLESYISMYTAMEGKHIIMPVFYAARENILDSAASYIDSIPGIISQKRYREEYRNYIRLLAGQLSRLENIPQEKAETLIKDSLRVYIKKIHPDFFTTKGRLKQQLKNLRRRIDFPWVKAALNRRRNAAPSQFSPLDLKDGAHWTEIEKFILKHKFIYNNKK